ncbi:MAG: alpha/beta fold hydrolase [Planctomycetota bacterium]|jgi:predicted esterase
MKRNLVPLGRSPFPLVVIFLFLLSGPDALARGKPKLRKAPAVTEKDEKGKIKLTLEDDPAAVGWLLKVGSPEEGKKYELLVSLHGHGGTPILFSGIARQRNCFVLAVQGHSPTGPGFAWSDSDKKYVAGLTLYVIEKYPVDRKRVVMTGHSAGGTMTLATYKYAPELYAGIMTTAAPATPDSSHFKVRTVVFLGDQDPNFGGAGSVRSNFSNKKRRAPGSLRIVKGLGHNVPDRFYLDQAITWLLHPKARGWEVALPKNPPVKGSKPFAHILIRYAGAEGADERAKRTKKSRAKSTLKLIRKFLDKKMADIFMEAAKHSHDDQTAASGGYIDEEGLAVFAPSLKEEAAKLEPGKISEVLESPQGFHVILRLEDPTKKEK